MSLSNFPAPIHKNVRTTMGRINGFYSSNNIFSNINLSSKIYLGTQSTRELTTFPILGPHGTWKDYTKEDILNAPYIPAVIGGKFGPTWTTHWFQVSFDPPPTSWNGKEIHFRFFTGTEAMLYDTELNVLQGLSPNFRNEYVLTTSYTSDPVNIPLEFYVEMACNHISGGGTNVPGHSSMILPPDPNRFWTLELLDLAVFSRENFNFLVSIEQLYGIADQLPDTHVGMQSMFVANEMVTLFSEGKTQEGNELADAFFAQGAGTKAHTLYAMGHCHIDSAWLWPFDETIRKCARSFSAQLKLMEEYPFYKFVCSSAQHYAWIEEFYPDLFLRIGDMIRSGKFVPVGGAWVELVENFCGHILKKYERLDILIQNAAQTVRKPVAFYKDLIDGEHELDNSLKNDETCAKAIRYFTENRLTQVSQTVAAFSNPEFRHSSKLLVHPEDFKCEADPALTLQHFPRGKKDADGQQVDLRPNNSWVMELDQVEIPEMAEVAIVNYMAPYVILNKLTPLLKRQKQTKRQVILPSEWGFVILVSAMEGKFTNCYKSSKHAHTNAAKAALNMLVRTGAVYYKGLGILMNAVDTGWVTDEHPVGHYGDGEFNPPLDSVDGAARVLAPIFETINTGDVFYGKFFKDYRPTGW